MATTNWKRLAHLEWEGLCLKREEPTADDERARFGWTDGRVSVGLFIGSRLAESCVQVRVHAPPGDDVMVWESVGQPTGALRQAARGVAMVRLALDRALPQPAK